MNKFNPALGETLMRGCVAGALGIFVIAAFQQWRLDPSRVTLLMLMVSETITAGMVICSRSPIQRDWRPLSIAASMVASFFFLGLKLDPGAHLIPETFGVALQIAGILIQIYAKLSLGRSFGILPATRQLVTHGAYRWLRHPIYFGYLVGHIGFLLTNCLFQNVMVLSLLYVSQVIRIRREERILCSFPAYADYCRSVRYRLVPGVY